MANIKNEILSAAILAPRVFKTPEFISLSADNIGLVGPSQKGPAFVSKTFISFDSSDSILNTFENVFGKLKDLTEVNQSQLAVYESFNQGAEQVTFVRGLGAGLTGIPDESGIVSGSGFFVGRQVVSGSSTPNNLGSNKFSSGDYEGRVNFICTAYQNNNFEKSDNSNKNVICTSNDYLEQIGYDSNVPTGYLINHAIICPSGSRLLMSEKFSNDDAVLTAERNEAHSGSTESRLGNFSKDVETNIYVDDLKDKDRNYISDYTLTLKNIRKRYLENSFNFNAANFLHKGHLNYGSFIKNNNDATILNQDDTLKHFIISGSNDNNTPVYENFESPYQTAKTPWVLSQPLNRNGIEDNRSSLFSKCVKLFRFHALDDGEIGNRYRIKITPQKLGDNTSSVWSKFSIKVSFYNLQKNIFSNLFEYKNLNLNPQSKDYIGRVFGTKREYYNFKTKKVEVEGLYENTNNHLRVEISENVEFDLLKSYEVMPSGFMPYPRINTSGLSVNHDNNSNTANEDLKQVPLSYNWNLFRDQDFNLVEEKYWGVCFDNYRRVKIVDALNLSNVNYDLVCSQLINTPGLRSVRNEIKNYYFYTKYFQNSYLNKNLNVWTTDLEDNNEDSTHSLFHLEKILYASNLLSNDINENELWKSAFYRRDGKKVQEISSLEGTAKNLFVYVNVDDLLKTNDELDSDHSKFLSFDFFTYGGFDGVNILDNDKRKLNQTAFVRESEDEANTQTFAGPTTFTYNTLHNIITDDGNCDIQILSFPEIGHHNFNKKVSNKAGEEQRYLSVLNTPEFVVEKDDSNQITGSGILKDYNIFITEPQAEAVDDLLRNRIVNSNIDEELADGISLTLDASLSSYYNNKFTINFCNILSSAIDLNNIIDRQFVMMPSYLAIKSIAGNINRPFDNITPNTFVESIVEIRNVLNMTFANEYNNDFSRAVKNSINTNSSINYIVSTINDSTEIIKLNSANTSTFIRNSLNRLGHNTRIMLDIKKKIKYSVLLDDMLFNQNVNQQPLNSRLNILLNNILNQYAQRRIISDYYVSINPGTDVVSRRRRLSNILNTSVAVSLFGLKEDKDIQEFKLSDVIRITQNSLTETNNQDIIEINVS